MHSLMNTPLACCCTIDSLSCRVAGVSLVRTAEGVGGGSSYPENGVLHLLDLAGLCSPGRSGPQFLQFALVALDAFLQLRDVVFRVPVPPIEHLAHTDQSVPLPLEVLEDTVSPGSGFVLQQALAGGKMPGGCCDASIQRGDIVGVDRVCVLGYLRQGLQGQGESEVIGG